MIGVLITHDGKSQKW